MPVSFQGGIENCIFGDGMGFEFPFEPHEELPPGANLAIGPRLELLQVIFHPIMVILDEL